eukprot:COSAG01_NODE_13550_length_1568_cov_20.049013_1_plen_164_part_00
MPATFVLVVCSQCRGTRWRLFAPLCTYHWLCTVEVHTTGYWLLNMCNKCVCCLIRVLVYGRPQLLVPLQLIVCSLVAYMPLAMYSWRTCHWSCAEQASDLSSLDGWPGTLHVQSLGLGSCTPLQAAVPMLWALDTSHFLRCLFSCRCLRIRFCQTTFVVYVSS